MGDLERMCKLWGLSPRQLIEGVPQSATPATAPTAGRLEHERAASDLADRIVADPAGFGLAASTNPDKENEMNTPRE